MLKLSITQFHLIHTKLITSKLINELWELKLDEEKDASPEAREALTNIGLLEKQTNTAKKSVVFSKLVDAFYYQNMVVI